MGRFESSDHRFHQYACGCKPDEQVPEVYAQWVKHPTGPFSPPSTLPARSIFKVRASPRTCLRQAGGGLILVRELDERPGFERVIAQHLTDSRRGKNTQFPFAGLLPQSVYSRLAGYEHLNDAERPSHDPIPRGGADRFGEDSGSRRRLDQRVAMVTGSHGHRLL